MRSAKPKALGRTSDAAFAQGRSGRPLVPLLFGLLLSGCDGQSWNNPYPSDQAGQHIYYGSFSERPKHLDPAVAYSANEYAFIGQIYEPPLQYHFLKRPYRLVPLTAVEVPMPEYFDAQGNALGGDVPAEQVAQVRYRVRIRSGIRYQPHPALAADKRGRPLYLSMGPEQLEDVRALQDFPHVGSRELTADDYIYQIKRLVHPDIHSALASLMSDYILGLDELAAQLRQARQQAGPGVWLDLRDYELPGVRRIDAHTYDIILKKKYPQFIYWLAMPFFAPMPWEAERFHVQPGMKERNIVLDWYPIGTGAFMLTENNPNRRMVMVRNPNFRGERYPESGESGESAQLLSDAGRPMPFIDQAIYSLEREYIPLWNKFLQGYYDVSGIGSDSFDQAVQHTDAGSPELSDEMRAKGLRLLTTVNTSTFYMGFNMVDDVVGGDSDRARWLRRAIAIAVDYEEFIAIFGNGRGIPSQGPLPPGIFGHREGEAGINPYVYRWEHGRPQRRAVEEARALMRQAGYPDGRDQSTGQALTLHLDTYLTGPGARAGLNWLRKQFAKLGINLQVRDTDYNRFQEKMRKGTAQIYQWGWNADYPDPENFFFLLYGPNAEIRQQGKNASNYDNPEFNRLFVRMSSMDNGPERLALIDQMVEIARRDSPWLWGMHPVNYTLYHSWYRNAKPNLMANNTLKYKRIDPLQRDQLRRAWNRPRWQPVAALSGLSLAVAGAAWLAWRRRKMSRPEVAP